MFGGRPKLYLGAPPENTPGALRRGKTAAPGVWHFYSYWQDMKGDGGGKYWGNFFDPPQPAAIEPGRWTCVEAMLKTNSAPDAADGEQAFWVDGKKVGEFKGFRWRSRLPAQSRGSS